MAEPATPTAIRVVGVHRVEPTADEFREAVEWQWGAGLSDAELSKAEAQVRENYEGLRLVVIAVEPPGVEVDWGRVAQPEPGVDPRNWQVAYDERLLDLAAGTWAFFLHCFRPDLPLRTQSGDLPLPPATPTPAHLADITYQSP